MVTRAGGAHTALPAPHRAVRRIVETAMRAALGVAVLGGVAGFALLALQHVVGGSANVVLSGSMSPGMPVGSLAISRPVPGSSIAVGDVITFHPPGMSETITHRVVAVEVAPPGVPNSAGRTYLVTKGDANPANDAWRVPVDGAVFQRVVFHAPQLGYALHSLQLPAVRIALLVVPIVLFGLLALSEVWRDDDDEALRAFRAITT